MNPPPIARKTTDFDTVSLPARTLAEVAPRIELDRHVELLTNASEIHHERIMTPRRVSQRQQAQGRCMLARPN